METQTQVTRKDLNFINDIDLRNTLRDRLEELDRVFLVNGHYSTVFLAIGCIEGAFKHIAQIYKAEIKGSPQYPKKSNGQLKDFDNLTIDDLRILLTEQDILPSITKFEHVYNVFRDYRNFVHPQAHTRKGWQVGLGQAQMALGLLNATISELAEYIFIGKNRFNTVAGKPDFDSHEVLNLHRTDDSPLQSFVVLERDISDTLSLTFDLELPQGSVFNFVFNYKDDGNFKMFRLDNRKPNYNRVLHCTQKYHWRETLFVDPESPVDTLMPIVIKIDFLNKVFSVSVCGVSHTFKDRSVNRNSRDLFAEISPGLKIGFFNEEGVVRLSNIQL
jgi:hypothetical protein